MGDEQRVGVVVGCEELLRPRVAAGQVRALHRLVTEGIGQQQHLRGVVLYVAVRPTLANVHLGESLRVAEADSFHVVWFSLLFDLWRRRQDSNLRHTSRRGALPTELRLRMCPACIPAGADSLHRSRFLRARLVLGGGLSMSAPVSGLVVSRGLEPVTVRL